MPIFTAIRRTEELLRHREGCIKTERLWRYPAVKIKEQKIHSATEILARIKKALATGGSLSLIRLCSGEGFTLAHGTVLPLKRIPWWVEYAGVKLPNEKARQALLSALQNADIVGLGTDYSNWQSAPLLDRVLTAYKVKPKYITDSTINWSLHKHDRLYKVLGKTPTVLVGRLAPAAAPLLMKKGMQIVGAVLFEGFQELPSVEKRLLKGKKFRVALVAAGIPAAILCPRLARKTGCLAIDYGHVINDLLHPGFSAKDLPREKERWRRKKRRAGK